MPEEDDVSGNAPNSSETLRGTTICGSRACGCGQPLVFPDAMPHTETPAGAVFLRLDTARIPPETFEMTVDLARDVEDFVREQMRAGACAEPAQLVNNVLRSVRDQQCLPFPATPDLEAWLLESADQPATPLTEADFQAIRHRARDHRPLAP